ncbi:AMP-binding protein [Pseudoalteromonas sp. GB56]
MMADLATNWQGDIIANERRVSADEFWQHVEALSSHLRTMNLQCVAVELDNGLAWLVVDFALMQAGIVSLPLPHFFSASQREYALHKAQPQLLIRAAGPDLKEPQSWSVGEQHITLEPLVHQSVTSVEFPQGTQKITFTSGSTGQPKGVCLSAQQLLQVGASLVSRCGVSKPTHLCLLPLAVLLENVAGVYAPMLAGGSIHVPALASLGFDGTALREPQKLLAIISQVQPNTLILVPELLKGLVLACEMGWNAPQSLVFIAVGGAKVAPALIERARQLGLPVYQGYGLSEAGSVVSLASRIDVDSASVGQPLDHVEYNIVDGELILQKPVFLGYLGEPPQQKVGYATGDLVALEGGEIHILGRKKNQIILSNGRNVSPEWPESLLLSNSAISQVVVVGEGEACLCALIYCDPRVDNMQLSALVDSANEQLPNYANINNFLRLSTPLSIEDGYLSANQRPKREAINRGFATQISQLFQE